MAELIKLLNVVQADSREVLIPFIPNSLQQPPIIECAEKLLKMRPANKPVVRAVFALLLCLVCAAATVTQGVLNVHVVGHSHDDPGEFSMDL